VREFVERALAHVGETIAWRGQGVDETGVSDKSGAVLVRVDPRYFRPTEVEQLLADPSRAKQKLGWTHTTSFADLVAEMVDADMKKVASEQSRRNRHD
jgi:GDPmannose 4,6-dehydratase